MISSFEMNILIIEDNKKLAENIANVLRLDNYLVDLATTGQTGIELARLNQYALIILDLTLPDIDGIDVCSKLRTIEITTPILMLTARIDLTSKVEGLDSGADDYLTKPFLMDELLARVRALLRRDSQKKNSKIIITKDLTIDLCLREVIYENKKISLSPTEYRLLEYLSLNKGKSLSTGEIYTNVWGTDNSEVLFSDSLKVHIARLRKKTDPSTIKTIKGYGYSIE